MGGGVGCTCLSKASMGRGSSIMGITASCLLCGLGGSGSGRCFNNIADSCGTTATGSSTGHMFFGGGMSKACTVVRLNGASVATKGSRMGCDNLVGCSTGG